MRLKTFSPYDCLRLTIVSPILHRELRSVFPAADIAQCSFTWVRCGG
jgi:hypothetical protein